MAFWSDNDEPLRQHRWVANFSAAGLTGMTYALKKFDKPKAKIGEITHKYLNHFYYYPGRLEWEPVNMTFASVVTTDNSTTGGDSLYKALLFAGYGQPFRNAMSNQQNASTIGKKKFMTALGNVTVSQVAPDGVIRETWTFFSPFFTSVQFGTLDYANEEIVEITAVMRYDYARLEGTNSSADSTTGGLVNPQWPAT